MSRGWANASACRLQITLSRAVLCQIMSFQYLSRLSSPLGWSPLPSFLVVWSPSGDTRGPSCSPTAIYNMVDVPFWRTTSFFAHLKKTSTVEPHLIRPPSESHWCGRIRGMVAREGFVYEQKPLSVTRDVVVREGWSLVRVVVRQGFYCKWEMAMLRCMSTWMWSSRHCNL